MTKKILKSAVIIAIVSLGNTSVVLAQSLVPERISPDQSVGKPSYIGVVQNLPSGSWTQILAAVIQFILAITGSLAIIAFTYGGIVMLTAQGQDEEIGKGKGILMWSVMALIIIAISYAIVVGIKNIVFV